MANEKKEEVLHYLEKEESAFEKLDDLWRDKIDTTGITTVRELFARFEEEKGPLSLEDLNDLLRDLAYVHITVRVFPLENPTNSTSTGLLPDANVTGNLEATGRNNADVTCFQSFPALPMVSGRAKRPVLRLQNVLLKQPSSHDHDALSPKNICETVDNWEQELRKKNDRLKVKVRELEQELESEKAINAQHLGSIRHLHQQAVAKDSDRSILLHVQEQLKHTKETVVEERQARKILEEKFNLLVEQMKALERDYQEQKYLMESKIHSLESELQQNKHLEDRILELQQQLDLERFRHASTKEDLTRERKLRENLQQEHEQDKKQIEMCVMQERANLQQQLQQERANLHHQFQKERANLQQQYMQRIQQMQRVADENCARHQQPEQRSWIIQRHEVVISNNVLGQGSWGNVCEGTFRGTPVAVKQLHNVILSLHNRGLFEREMEIASRCRHPNLLQFIGATADDAIPLFVTELLDCNLRQLLDERQLNLLEIVYLALDVAKGLNYLHHNSPPIMHRDIKSDNVLIKRQDNDLFIAKVSDFGAANFVRRVMTPNQGTPVYSAPESGTEQYSQQADVYSYGVLILEMCTRQRPIPEQISEQVELEVTVSEPLKNLIHACIHQNPKNRPSMDCVIDFLTSELKVLTCQV